MVSIYRAEDQPPCAESKTFSKLLESSEERGDRKRIIMVDDGELIANEEGDELWNRDKCTTPTAKECRIPEMLTCPPAPRKRKGSFSRFPSSVRVKHYFVPPNLEALFVLDKVSTVK